MAAPEALRLYKSMLRQAAKFSGYNFRNFAFRKVRDEFVINRAVSDPAQIRHLLDEGHKSLALLTRQGTISQMYAMPDLVVEK